MTYSKVGGPMLGNLHFQKSAQPKDGNFFDHLQAQNQSQISEIKKMSHFSSAINKDAYASTNILAVDEELSPQQPRKSTGPNASSQDLPLSDEMQLSLPNNKSEIEPQQPTVVRSSLQLSRDKKVSALW
jgi:hypothetical protein